MTEVTEPTPESPSYWSRLRQFFGHDLWNVELSSLSLRKGVLIRLLRVGQLVIQGFRQDDLPLRASALTFITLMSLVPLLAFSFSMLKGLGGGEHVFLALDQQIAGMPESMGNLKELAASLLETLRTTSFFALGGAAMVFLLWTVIQVMGSIEDAFNRVWGVSTPRSLLRKITDYTGTLIFVTVLAGAVMAGGATMSLQSLVTRLQSIPLLERIVIDYVPMVKLVTFAVMWMGFALLYIFMPNTRVRVRAAVMSGLVTTMLFVGWQKIYMIAQVGVSRYNVFFGTFAAIPIFLAWLYVSWVIVLLGTELAFAIQNYTTFQMERAAPKASVESRLLLGLSVITRAAAALESNEPPFETSSFAKQNSVSIRLVHDVVALLAREHLLAEVAERDDCYVLLRSPGALPVREIVKIFLRDGTRPAELGLDKLPPHVQDVLVAMDDGMAGAVAEMTVRDLLTDSPAAAGAV